jgi:two-component sensor histidine kinase
MTIFKEYLRLYPEKKRDLLISEMNVDLLNAELQSIDAMQRVIRKMLKSEEDDYVKRGLENQLNEIEKVQEEFTPLEPFLSRIIGEGLKSRR